MDFSIKLVENEEEIKDALRVRKTVFIEEQNIPENRELDGLDGEAIHFLAKYGEKPVGTARVRSLDNKGKLERISLLKPYRGKGYGKELVERLVKYCREKGLSEVFLHSQLHLKDFYKKCGFKAQGKVFLDAGVKHIEMFREF